MRLYFNAHFAIPVGNKTFGSTNPTGDITISAGGNTGTQSWRGLEDALTWLLLEYIGRQTNTLKTDVTKFNQKLYSWALRIEHVSGGRPLCRNGAIGDVTALAREEPQGIEPEEFKMTCKAMMEEIEESLGEMNEAKE